MKRIVSIVLGLVLFVNTCFGYTFTLRYGNFVLTRQGIVEGTNVSFGNAMPMNYSVISGEVSPTRVDAKNANFAMPSNDVEIQLADQLLAEAVSVGDYVTYTPPTTSVTVTTGGGSKRFTPSNTTKWRVFKVSSGSVYLVSAASIGSITLNSRSDYNGSWTSQIPNAYVDSNFAKSATFPTKSDAESLKNNNLVPSGEFFTKTFSTSSYAECNACGAEGTDYSIYKYTKSTVNLGYFYYGCNCSFSGAACNLQPIVVLKNSVYPNSGDGTSASPYTIKI